MSRFNNNEIKSNCEAYMTKLLKRKPERLRSERSEQVRNVNDRPNSRLGTSLAISSNILPVSNKVESENALVKANEVQVHQNSNQLVHREIFDNAAAVEVTVRTLGRKRSESNISCKDNDCWGKILQSNSDEDISLFRGFDPIRTLRFLSKELQRKLQSICPGDSNLQNIIFDMQQALHRLPPNIVDKTSCENIHQCEDAEISEVEKKSSNKILKNSQSTQTIGIEDLETKKMRKQLEITTSKLEESVRLLEVTSKKLKDEKEGIANELEAEKEIVKCLREEISSLTYQQNEKSSRKISDLESECDTLRSQFKNLQAQIQVEMGPAKQDLHTLISDLRTDQLTAEKENAALKNELTIMKLEKDKMNVILATRDKQLKALRAEMDHIQTMICSQLNHLKNKQGISPSSSISSITQAWALPLEKNSYKNKIKEIYMHSAQTALIDSNSSLGNKKTDTQINGDRTDHKKGEMADAHKGTMDIKDTYGKSDMTLNSNITELESDQDSLFKDIVEKMKREARIYKSKLSVQPSTVSTISNTSRSS